MEVFPNLIENLLQRLHYRPADLFILFTLCYKNIQNKS